MKKPKKQPSRPRAHKRNRTKNPLFTLVNPPDFPIPAGTTIPVEILDSPFDPDMERIAADLIVQAALANCSPSEKILIAALIPSFLKVIRLKGGDPEANPDLSSAQPPDEAPPSGEAKE
jgi:hypothetical protein